MTEQISLAVSIITLLDKMGGWGIGTIICVLFIAPPVLGFFATRTVAKVIRSLEQRIVESDAKTERLFTAMSTKYDNNVILVEDFGQLVRNHQALNDALIEIVKSNTEMQTRLVERIGAVLGRGA